MNKMRKGLLGLVAVMLLLVVPAVGLTACGSKKEGGDDGKWQTIADLGTAKADFVGTWLGDMSLLGGRLTLPESLTAEEQTKYPFEIVAGKVYPQDVLILKADGTFTEAYIKESYGSMYYSVVTGSWGVAAEQQTVTDVIYGAQVYDVINLRYTTLKKDRTFPVMMNAAKTELEKSYYNNFDFPVGGNQQMCTYVKKA